MGGDVRLNLRIFLWHLMIYPNWKIRLEYNDYHKGLKHGWFKLVEYKYFFQSRDKFDQNSAN
jgi:hypothetical protein